MLPLVPILVCCVVAAISALLVVLMKRPVHVAISLLVHSLSLAALYMSLDAQFSAVAQVLIYSGAIVVLFLIVVALLPSGGKEQLTFSRMAVSISAFAVTGLALVSAAMSAKLTSVTTGGFSVKEVGSPLFHELIVGFELTAPLLLAAIIGAIVLWRRQEKPKGQS